MIQFFVTNFYQSDLGILLTIVHSVGITRWLLCIKFLNEVIGGSKMRHNFFAQWFRGYKSIFVEFQQ